MRLLAIASVTLLAVMLASGAWADTPRDGVIYDGSGGSFEIPEGSRDFMEGWNENGVPSTSYSYGATCFGFPFTPSMDYWMNRIELVAGGSAGTATFWFLEDDGSGFPTGPVLATGSYDQSATHGWQGADLDQCVPVQQGVLYYIKLLPVNGSYCSIATAGTPMPHFWGDCNSWSGPSNSFPWMAKFFGSFEPTDNEIPTWSGIKALYR